MKKIKDFIYDYNDILLAIIIILVAAAVIFVKVSDIMAYPQFAKEAQQQEQTDVDFSDVDLEKTDVDPIVAPGDDIGSDDNTDDPQGNNQAPADNPTPVAPSKDVTFEVKQGEYFSTVAKNLKDKGLITDTQAFIKKVQDMGLEKKLQIGTYTIPAGSTDEQIAKIVTKTN